MPLYLEQIDDAFLEAEVSNKQLLAKPFSYLHFYEGFMIAVDSMVSQYDMKLDLKVYDVDQDTNKVVSAINDPWLVSADIIVGPFHVKAFERVMTFAAENDILIKILGANDIYKIDISKAAKPNSDTLAGNDLENTSKYFNTLIGINKILSFDLGLVELTSEDREIYAKWDEIVSSREKIKNFL